MEKVDCFAYENRGKCYILREKKCDKCRFYKIRWQFDMEQEGKRKNSRKKSIVERYLVNVPKPLYEVRKKNK